MSIFRRKERVREPKLHVRADGVYYDVPVEDLVDRNRLILIIEHEDVFIEAIDYWTADEALIRTTAISAIYPFME